jgi:hypothetical protein
MTKRGGGLSAAFYVMHAIITSNVGTIARKQYNAGGNQQREDENQAL